MERVYVPGTVSGRLRSSAPHMRSVRMDDMIHQHHLRDGFSNLFSLVFVYLQYLFISRFGFKSGIFLLIAQVPVHCFFITFF